MIKDESKQEDVDKIRLLRYVCLVLLFTPVLGGTGCKGRSMAENTGNHLGREKSPYLLQHKDNPVHWYAWGKEAFEAARKENKLIFLSIGYSTCHWCHVMEHESFETQEVADVMNRHFISIKVDREERPDVDKIYMDAVVGMTGRGGWPLSVFLTPDLKPFFGGTYYPKDAFIKILQNVNQLWETQREKIVESGQQLATHLQEATQNVTGQKVSEDLLVKAFDFFRSRFDETWGGFGPPPKFPKSVELSLLLRIHHRSGESDALKMVETTLDKMARGGMYDHLGGGFARYSTDKKWLVPHFEKMLYDNALLVVTYLEAYQVTGKSLYSSVARETLDYILRAMTDKQGGFYSAEDADSEGEEGKFYVWNEGKLSAILSPAEFDLFKKVYGVTPEGNFAEHGKPNHHANILSLSNEFGWEIKEDPRLKNAQKKLFEVREKRIHPHKDDKILTDWNGLMIAAMAKGYQVLGDERYLEAAQNSAKFIRDQLWAKIPPKGDFQLLHRYRDGESRIEAMLDDYSFLIHGLISLYESDFNPDWLSWARDLQDKQDELFWDTKEGGYFLTPENQPDLIVRGKEYYDGALPSGNSVALLNLLRLMGLTFETRYRDQAVKLFTVFPLSRHPAGAATALMAVDYHLGRSKEIAVIGMEHSPQTQEMRRFLYQSFLPNKVLAMGYGEKKDESVPLLSNRGLIDKRTTIYVCEGGTCLMPTTDVELAKKMILEPR